MGRKFLFPFKHEYFILDCIGLTETQRVLSRQYEMAVDSIFLACLNNLTNYTPRLERVASGDTEGWTRGHATPGLLV